MPCHSKRFRVGLPGGVEIAVMGIRSRLELLIEYAKTPPSTRKEILDFFFIFAPSYIKVVPELGSLNLRCERHDWERRRGHRG